MFHYPLFSTHSLCIYPRVPLAVLQSKLAMQERGQECGVQLVGITQYDERARGGGGWRRRFVRRDLRPVHALRADKAFR